MVRAHTNVQPWAGYPPWGCCLKSERGLLLLAAELLRETVAQVQQLYMASKHGATWQVDYSREVHLGLNPARQGVVACWACD